MQFSIEVEGAKQLSRDLDKVNHRVKSGIIRAVSKTTYGIDKDAKKGAPSVSGRLRSGIRAVVRDAQGQVSASTKYSYDVEKGQKPGKWANVEDLMLWVRKVINPGRKRLRSVTFLVNRKIYKEGTTAQPFFEPAVEKHRKRFRRRIEIMLKKL